MSYLGDLPAPLARVVEALSSLPGIGPKTALRLSVSMLSRSQEDSDALAESVRNLTREISFCDGCGCFAQNYQCRNCETEARGVRTICVVEQPVDVLMMSRSHFSCTYHVLHGRLSPVDGIGVEQLRIKALEKRLSGKKMDEMVLALSATMDGEATAHYLAQTFTDKGVSISRIARGIPEGSELEYLDEYTLSRAMNDRVSWPATTNSLV